MTTLLIVEDEAVVALDIESRLSKAGYRICGTASTGEKAIRLALERKPDLVLMDIHIKGDIDGIETSNRMRKLIDIPVIFVTSYADQEVLQRAKDSHPFGYIVKPFEDRELHAAIQIGLLHHACGARKRDTIECLRAENQRLLQENEQLAEANERLRLLNQQLSEQLQRADGHVRQALER